jgi:hypothetical protein
MIEIPNTTLCSIDCINYELALTALNHSSRLCRFERVLFLTDRPIECAGIEVMKIPTLKSKEHYSSFMIKNLSNYIETDFVLVVQYDGFVINPNSWTTEFHTYDYIGAKWRYTDGLNVGNGGFSLRSKRLLQALRGDDFPADRDSLLNGEDHFICRLSRKFLEEKYHIRFAPETIADKFSYEYVEPPGVTFGFHGLFNVWQYIQEEDLASFANLLSPKTLSTKETLFLALNYHKQKRFRAAKIIYQRILAYHPHNTGVSLLLDRACKNLPPGIPA